MHVVTCDTHADVIELLVPDAPKAPAPPIRLRHSLQRMCSVAERARVEQWRRARAAPPEGAGLEDTIRRFAMTTEGPLEMPLPKLSGAERAVAHKVAESLGLEHVRCDDDDGGV